jgi:hypothetical protein
VRKRGRCPSGSSVANQKGCPAYLRCPHKHRVELGSDSCQHPPPLKQNDKTNTKLTKHCWSFAPDTKRAKVGGQRG